jgi:hypothetical protein
MQDASEECMKECKERYTALLASTKSTAGESTIEFSERKRAVLIDGLIGSGCADEGARSRLNATPILGLIGELCGCECSGYFPFKASSSMAELDLLEGVHPPPNGAVPP